MPTMKTMQLHHGDCLDVMRAMPSNSVDSIVTDPPYGLSFMGKKWDYDVPGVEIWAECLRVLKPGGHLLAFAGTRTQHRMAVRIEDAGFEIRDMIAWVYGSGFPKSLDVSKAIDKAAGAERDVIGVREDFAKRMSLSKRPGTANVGGYVNPQAAGEITAPATDDARQWHGWGTALKPALEPITVARKPLIGTVVANVLKYGTGALNIDACRVDSKGEKTGSNGAIGLRPETGWNNNNMSRNACRDQSTTQGRWPANLIHDGSDEVLAGFPEVKPHGKPAFTSTMGGAFGNGKAAGSLNQFSDTGSAARFFYCAKASRADRNEGLHSGDAPAVATDATMREREDADWPARNGNHHPTVKPTDLMAYLCRLVTPPGGVVLDPFMGSGSTGKAAVREGFHFVGIEREAEYLRIAQARISAQIAATREQQTPPPQNDLFSEILQA